MRLPILKDLEEERDDSDDVANCHSKPDMGDDNNAGGDGGCDGSFGIPESSSNQDGKCDSGHPSTEKEAAGDKPEDGQKRSNAGDVAWGSWTAGTHNNWWGASQWDKGHGHKALSHALQGPPRMIGHCTFQAWPYKKLLCENHCV